MSTNPDQQRRGPQLFVRGVATELVGEVESELAKRMIEIEGDRRLNETWPDVGLIRQATHIGQSAGKLAALGEQQFEGFGCDVVPSEALTPLCQPSVIHCPCLAVHGTVISMSMPDPARPTADSEAQSGRKPSTWGKLLPGWFLLPAGNGQLRAHGPAAVEEGLELPLGTYLDAEGFLGWKDPSVARGFSGDV